MVVVRGRRSGRERGIPPVVPAGMLRDWGLDSRPVPERKLRRGMEIPRDLRPEMGMVNLAAASDLGAPLYRFAPVSRSSAERGRVGAIDSGLGLASV